MRLIDADELLYHLSDHQLAASPSWGTIGWASGNAHEAVKACIKAIKDAPTVKDSTDEWCYNCKEYDQEKKCCPRINKVIRNSLNEIRPRGKWVPIERQLFGHSVIWDYCCSRCKEKAYKDEDGNHFLTNFCPDCGADMRGGDE